MKDSASFGVSARQPGDFLFPIEESPARLGRFLFLASARRDYHGKGGSLLIRMQALTKKFGDRTAVDGLQLEIKAGEVFGLLGPNGAGKTTTIRMLTLLTQPTAGDIAVGGFSARRDAKRLKALIGVVPQHVNLDQDLTVAENLDLHGRLYHMSSRERRRRAEELLCYVELDGRRDDKVQSLSGGMKRRLLIARALMHKPRVLLLDEPTVALDPQVRRRLWDLIRRMQQDGITVLLTTHYIEEAENLCGRVAILEKGRLIALDTPQNLCERVGSYVVEWDGPSEREARFFARRDAAAAFAGTLEAAATVRKSNLEDVFVELTGRKVNG